MIQLRNLVVANWVLEVASRRSDAEFELVDLRDFPLPHLDEPLPPSLGRYQNEHTRQWAEKIASFDGFVLARAPQVAAEWRFSKGATYGLFSKSSL